MNPLRLVVAVILSCLSTAIMSYIAMAMPIGPWIETTLVLAGMIIFSVCARFIRSESRMHDLGLTTAAGGIGGILATGLGFSFPTLYFIDPATFDAWMNSPLYFASMVAGLSFCAGSFGLLVAELFEHRLITEQQMPFPIGELVYKMISAQQSMRQAASLAAGFVGTQLFLFVQLCSRIIPQSITLMHKYTFSVFSVPTIMLKTDVMPMFLAIGFVTGHVIVLPLVVGFLAKIGCIDPLHVIYTQTSNPIHVFFAHTFGTVIHNFFPTSLITNPTDTISTEEFSVAFCSGMVLYGVITSFIGLPKVLVTAFKNLGIINVSQKDSYAGTLAYMNKLTLLHSVGVLSVTSAFLTYCQFSFLAQLYLLSFTFLWTYQVLIIAGKIGLAPLGRFATFVMVPAMALFGLTMVQITFIATFVEVAVGVASDVLFGRKMAQLAGITRANIRAYQWLGLVISCAVVGFIFWLLIAHLGLGSTGELPVYKAYTRALLITIKNFDIIVLCMGLVFGYFLTYTKINPALVLGGILMPANYSLMLIAGGLLTYVVKEKEDYYPLWSGIFAANSLWMLIRTLVSYTCRI